MRAKTFLFYLDRHSIYLRTPFWLKFGIFFVVSMVGLLTHSNYLNAVLTTVCLILIWRTGFVRARPAYLRTILVSSLIFCGIWLSLSRVPGDKTYVSFAWGTFVTNRTLDLMLAGFLRWALMCLAGLLLLITSSQEEMVEELISFHAPYPVLLIFTVAFNTITFTIESLGQINTALRSRDFEGGSPWRAFNRIRHIGTAILLDNLKRVVMLRIAYFLEANDIARVYGARTCSQSISTLPDTTKQTRSD